MTDEARCEHRHIVDIEFGDEKPAWALVFDEEDMVHRDAKITRVIATFTADSDFERPRYVYLHAQIGEVSGPFKPYVQRYFPMAMLPEKIQRRILNAAGNVNETTEKPTVAMPDVEDQLEEIELEPHFSSTELAMITEAENHIRQSDPITASWLGQVTVWDQEGLADWPELHTTSWPDMWHAMRSHALLLATFIQQKRSNEEKS